MGLISNALDISCRGFFLHMMQYSSEADEEDLGYLLLEVLPGDVSTMGNQSAREALSRAAERTSIAWVKGVMEGVARVEDRA